MAYITLVKKLKADGNPCRKCVEVEERLHKDGHYEAIDRIVIADEKDPNSEGMRLAAQYRVDRAPFFLVKDAGGTRVYTVYLKLVKEVLKAPASRLAMDMELLNSSPDLDFI